MEQATFDFILGIAIGLEIELGNTTECIRRGTLTLTEFKEAFHYLESGIEHFSLDDFERGGEALGTALASIPTLMTDCGAIKLKNDIENAIILIRGGVIRFLIKESVVIVVHGKELTSDVKAIIADFHERKYRDSGVALGKILGILLGVKPKTT